MRYSSYQIKRYTFSSALACNGGKNTTLYTNPVNLGKAINDLWGTLLSSHGAETPQTESRLLFSGSTRWRHPDLPCMTSFVGKEKAAARCYRTVALASAREQQLLRSECDQTHHTYAVVLDRSLIYYVCYLCGSKNG